MENMLITICGIGSVVGVFVYFRWFTKSISKVIENDLDRLKKRKWKANGDEIDGV